MFQCRALGLEAPELRWATASVGRGTGRGANLTLRSQPQNAMLGIQSAVAIREGVVRSHYSSCQLN